jgi:hypothetical protein
MSRAARFSALLVAVVLAGCGGGDDDSGSTTKAPETLPRGLAPPVTLRKTYTFQGKTHRVDTSVLPGSLLDPWRNPAVPVPERGRLVAVQMTWFDRGDAFPRDWARYSGKDDKGTTLSGAFLGPARRSGRITIQPVGFILDRGRRLVQVGMTSIVDVWRFQASWRLRSAP